MRDRMNCGRCGRRLWTVMEHDTGLCSECVTWLEKAPPLCGREWFDLHRDDVLPEQSIQIYCDGKPIVHMSSSVKPGTLKKLLKEMRGTGRR